MKIIKKISIVALVTASAFGYSQSLEPVEDRIEYKEEFAECWKVTLTPEADDLKSAFKRFVKDRYDVKLKGKGMFSNKDVMTAEDVTIPKISSKRINFYASIIEDDGQSEMKLFGNYGYSLFFNKDKQKEEFQALRGIMVDFMNSYLPEYYSEQVKDASKKYDKFVEEDEDLTKKIEDNKKEIDELTNENQELAEELERNKEQITQSKETLVKTQEQFDGIKKQLSSIKR